MAVSIDIVVPAAPLRPDESHKGTYGSVLVVAGSRGMSGAACLAGLGARGGGAGLVTVAVPAGILPIVAALEPSYLTVGLPDDDGGRISRRVLGELLSRAADSTAVAIGPGWGQSPDLVELAQALHAQVAQPLVIDADAINALANTPGGFPASRDKAARVLTPHPGEFARLAGLDTKAVQADRETLAAEFAKEHGVIVVLKGHRSVITDGQKAAINTTGNSGMATGGTGDVLTGLVAALLAQGMGPFEAGHLGAHLHGLAGDLAAAELSKPGLIASDLPRYLAKAWLQVAPR